MDPAPPLDVAELLDQLPVALHEAVPRMPAALDQPGADEHLPGDLAGGGGAHARQGRGPVRHERHAVQQDLLVDHGGAVARGPVGLAEDVLGQARPLADLLDPAPIDPGHRARE